MSNENTNLGEILESVQHHVVCIQNLCVRRMQFQKKGDKQNRLPVQYDCIALLTHGVVGATIDSKDYTIFEAPHMIILEKDHEYDFEALEDNAEVYDISALRHATGDIVNPENLVRANYPFNPEIPLEEQVKE